MNVLTCKLMVALLILAAGLTGCKERSESRVLSGEHTTGQATYDSKSRTWRVVCKKNFIHTFKDGSRSCSPKVSAAELETVCETEAASECGDKAWDLKVCDFVAPKVYPLNVVIDVTWQEELASLPYDVAYFNLCKLFLGRLSRAVTEEPSFEEFLRQGNGKGPYLLRIVKDGDTLRRESNELIVPWQHEMSREKLASELSIELKTICAGKLIEDVCWYLGKAGESCTKVCLDKKKLYDERTGLGDNNRVCELVATNFDKRGDGKIGGIRCGDQAPSFGCSFFRGTVFWCAPATRDAAHADASRFCACKAP